MALKQVLFFAATTGYQTRMFGEAAARLGVSLLFVTDRCDQLTDPWADQAIAVRFDRPEHAAGLVRDAVAGRSVAGVLAVGDRPAVAAAHAAQLLGLPGHPPAAACAAADKRLTRACLAAAGVPVPACTTVPASSDPAVLSATLSWPVVVKPLFLSGSRGVIRADDPHAFVAAFTRVTRLLASPSVRALNDPAGESVLIEAYVPGREFALEGVLHGGALQTFAIFDKPDPLVGPFFEETIYVTPSRESPSLQGSIERAVTAAADALGLRHGPVHAECRVDGAEVYVLEVAARPIGGLCARAVTLRNEHGQRADLEEVLLRHASGERVDDWRRVDEASGVMMVPIPVAGRLREVQGLDEARTVSGVSDVRITAQAGQLLVPLPEGASYLGFIFAQAPTPAVVERALRDAHRCLRILVDRDLPVV